MYRTATRSHFTPDCNPPECPCGYFADSERACTCSPALIARYQKRVSGPLRDRIDIHVGVPRVNDEKLTSDRPGEPSARIRERVIAARMRRHERFAGTRLGTKWSHYPFTKGRVP